MLFRFLQVGQALMLGAFFVLASSPSTGFGQEEMDADNQSGTKNSTVKTKTEWGSIDSDSRSGLVHLTIEKPAPTLSLPTPFSNITRATLGTYQWPGDALMFSFNQDASEITLRLPNAFPKSPVQAVLETAEKSKQFPDGRIVLSALDATVHGTVAKLETHPGNHRIGFWSNADDFVGWKYKATRPGKYRLVLTYSVAGEPDSKASDVEFTIGETRLTHTLAATGSWYDYRSVEIGELCLPKPEECSITVQCVTKRGGAVMNLKALTLIPACEGTPPVQSADGTILLHAADSTIHGTLLQWEPGEKKRTIGYWANVDDSASWDFTVIQAGKFDVEILQGCGKGAGGSTTEFTFYAENRDEPLTVLPHTVIDTGHWQAFKPFMIGQVNLVPGNYRLRVTATSKAANAVMDLRQVELRLDNQNLPTMRNW